MIGRTTSIAACLASAALAACGGGGSTDAGPGEGDAAGSFDDDGAATSAASTTSDPEGDGIVGLDTVPAADRDVPGSENLYFLSNSSTLVDVPDAFNVGYDRDFVRAVVPLSHTVEGAVVPLPYAYRHTQDASFIGIVENRSSEVACGVELSGIEFFSADGSLIDATIVTARSLIGSLGSTPESSPSGAVSTRADCLSPNERAYFSFAETSDADTAARIVVGDVSHEPGELSPQVLNTLEITIGPLQEPQRRDDSLRLVVRNDGLVPIDSASADSRASDRRFGVGLIFLDRSGAPLYHVPFGHSDDVRSEFLRAPLAPGESRELFYPDFFDVQTRRVEGDIAFLRGTVGYVRVFLEHEGVTFPNASFAR